MIKAKDWIDELQDNASPTDTAKLITKETGEDVKSTEKSNIGGGGGSALPWEISIPAGAVDYPDVDFAPWEKYSGSNIDIIVNWFDDTTEQFILFQFEVPSDAAVSGDVTFKLKVTMKSANTSKKVAVKFYYHWAADAEDIDVAQVSTNGLSPDMPVNDNALYNNELTFTKTLAELGVAPGDTGFMLMSRVITAVGGDQASGDMGYLDLKIYSDRA
jgi:hypothetical protein